MDDECFLAVETNNLETFDSKTLLQNGLMTARNLSNCLKNFNVPILVPILPSVSSKKPYYQQLSRECFDLSKDNPYYRLDLQVVNIVQEAKQHLSSRVNLDDKIFLNGYSASGVFAERFALLHPEMIEMACIGGASGSIPVPTDQLEYPLGIKDYALITGKEFDMESYTQIKLRYYVGELEDKRKTSERYDEEGKAAPMHDMSYFDRSVPPLVGSRQRALFGKNLLERSQRQMELLQDMGLDATQEIIVGRSHNNQSGLGVNEIGDRFVSDCYQAIVSDTKLK